MPIRTAIIGYGRSGSTMHAGALANHPAFTVAAVCDTDAGRRADAAARFGCPTFDDYHRMLAEVPLDLACIITRSDQHCAMTCDALAAGVHVLVTKPWAVNEAEARRMIAAQQAAGRRLFPWLPARWGSDLVRLRALVQSGAIGNVFLVRRCVSSFAMRDDWQTARRYGGGYLLNWGPHIVDQALLLLDSPVAAAYGQLRRVINPGDAEDLFYAVMTLRNGAIVQAEYTVSLEPLPSWIIQGDRGTIIAHGRQLTIRTTTPARPADPTHFAAMQADAAQVTDETVGPEIYGDEHRIYAELAEALLHETPFPVTPADALELTRVLDAVRHASETGQVVTLRAGARV